ncbi:hypothetical protein D9M69_455590 [compost metagenome]
MQECTVEAQQRDDRHLGPEFLIEQIRVAFIEVTLKHQQQSTCPKGQQCKADDLLSFIEVFKPRLVQYFLAPTPKLVIRLQHPPQGNTRSEQMTVHEKHFEHCLDLIIVLALRSLLR